MGWLKENEGTKAFSDYLEDPVNFVCWYCHTRGLTKSAKDWHILRQTQLKKITDWRDIFKILDYRETPLTQMKKRLTEEDLNKLIWQIETSREQIYH